MNSHLDRNRILLSLFILLEFSSCSNAPKDIPFPINDNGYLQPTSKKVKFSKPVKFEWVSLIKGKVPVTEKKLYFDTISSKSIDLLDFKNIIKPLYESDLVLNSVSKTSININLLPSKSINWHVTLLGEPVRVKAGFPRQKDDLKNGVLIFDQNQGLPDMTGQALLRDKFGIIWIGTEHGLCRFDGENCDLFSTSQGLSNNVIYKLFEDSKGQIWICSDVSGIDVLDLKMGIIKHLSTKEGLINNGILSVMEDSRNQIWVGTNGGGVNIINQKTGTIKCLAKEQGLNDNLVFSLLEDKFKQIWIGTFGGISIINFENQDITGIGKKQGMSDDRILTMMENSDGDIWVGTGRGGINIIDLKSGKIKYINNNQGLSDNRVLALMEDSMHQYWVGTVGGGVDIIDANLNKIKNLDLKSGLTNNLIWSLMEDKNNNVWIGTGGGGINIINNTFGILRNLHTDQGLSNNQVLSMLEDRIGQIWISTAAGGVDLISRNYAATRKFNKKNGLTSFYVRCIIEDSVGQIWMGTQGDGIYIINQKSGSFKHLDTSNGLSNNYAVCLLLDKKNQIWIGTSGGGINITDQNVSPPKFINIQQGLSDNMISCLIQDDEGQIWCGTNSAGVNVIDQVHSTVKHLGAKQGLSNDQILCLNINENQQIFIGTNGGGLNILNKRGKLLTILIENGIADNAVVSIKEKKGIIYLGTGKGITILTQGMIKKDSEKSDILKSIIFYKIQSLGKLQGFQSIDFNPNSVMIKKNGQLWWGSGQQLTIMEAPQKDSFLSQTYINGIDIMENPINFSTNKLLQYKKFNSDTLWNTRNDTYYLKSKLPADTCYLVKNKIIWDSLQGPWNIPGNLSLPFNQKFISLHFTGMQTGNPGKTRYRYVLEGFDKTWNKITDKSFADYKNLSPGKYKFIVRSMGFNGLWGTPASINITILPPWWQTWWFYGLCGFALIALIWQAVRIRTAHLRKRNIELEVIVANRTAELSEANHFKGKLFSIISHDLRNPLTDTYYLLEALKNPDIQKEDVENLTMQLSGDYEQNLQLYDNLISWVSNEIKGIKIDAVKINIMNDLIVGNLKLVESAIRNKNLKINIKAESNLVAIADLNIANLVMRNLLFNAVKYTPSEGSIEIDAKEEEGYISIYVKDSGIGMDAETIKAILAKHEIESNPGTNAETGFGIGLQLSKEFIEKNGGSLHIQSTPGVGSICSFTLPAKVLVTPD